jgi:hypothetical protein
MAENNPVLNKKINYTEEFQKKYGRTFDVPTSNIKQCTFHPTLLDHLVVVSEIQRPKVSLENMSVLKHDYMDDGNFVEQIKDRYMDEAERHVARRGNKSTRTMTFQKDISDSNSLPEEPDSDEWEDSDIFDNEGGTESRKKKAKPILPPKKKAKKVKRDNEIIIDKSVKVKGEYPKAKTEAAKVKEQNEKLAKAESYNRA